MAIRDDKRVRAAAVQMASGPNLAGNLAEVERLIGQAAEQGAELVGLPENFALMGRREADKLDVAESDGEGPIQDLLAKLASRHRIHLVAGTLPLRSENPGKVRAACLLYGPDGRRLGRYDKVHLFDVGVSPTEAYRESDTLEPGSRAVVVETELGRIGLAVCYDVRFPEQFREMARQGMEILVLPSAFTAVTGAAHWRTLVTARAIENLCFTVAPDQGGRHASGRETYGDSLIVDPWGSVLASRAKGAGVVVADLDLHRQAEIRRRFPALTHRKF
ncbi:carbon-nitrogen hydrolase family protein [Alkalilimnicola ehrlichii MLHE-1]|uniref:Nitrilase/cyanide hydratase and apolipoprotein N-acyltransferase n=1 Tax=Alkalilimnicola ehrlichii (strain ATCC BAA-1101 / DSM 17681 / MLHE-1) TaxID=187272 RepID=Q0ABM2_ALKEH|nr:carbon-nitrogen hydrolase family protein [Alkalilimnicola ehrlichii]ABI55765.1 Nitrilase/cyanide hydratase and apolipoprotein N-acyltransferase [Alkalilimnicola ehrlichii MLHE-1]